MWHVSSHSSVATVRTAIHLLLACLLTYLRGDNVNARPTQPTTLGETETDSYLRQEARLSPRDRATRRVS